jgi:uncharacterized protein YndB with AHSA1/START domain
MNDIVVTRRFDAPLEQVWQAWSEPEQVRRWWGPMGFTCPVADMDFREGGSSLVCMRSPDGQEFYNRWTYEQIAPMERIEFVLSHADASGARVDPAEVGLPPGIPQDVRHVVTFRTTDAGQTEMTVTEYGYEPGFIFDLSKAGLEQCLDKMAASLSASEASAPR